MTLSRPVKVGIFLVGGVLLFAAGLFLIGNHKQVFAHHFDVYTEFTKVDTLQDGAKIRVSGMDAGDVTEISIPQQPSGKFRLKLHVDKKFQNVVRQDSLATIETEGMVGDKYVNIAKGSNGSPPCNNGCTLRSEEPFEIGDLMRQGKDLLNTTQGTITDIQHRADSIMGHVDGTIVAVRGNVERIASNGAHITDNVDSIVSGVRAGRGTVGKLMTDEEMAKQVDAAIADAKKTSANLQQASAKADEIVAEFQKQNIPQDVHQTVANARDMSQQLKKGVGDFLSGGQPGQSTATALRETIEDAHQATRNLASDTEAIKHNFFLRGFFHKRGFYNLAHLNPTEYAASQFVKHPSKRVWLSADGLFTKSSNGAQELSDQGRSTLENAVSEIADDLPNNPIMVEGYANAGSPADRYVAALQRANAVKQYLQSRFQLKPDLVGTIALENPPQGAGKTAWDGVSLSLLVSRN